MLHEKTKLRIQKILKTSLEKKELSGANMIIIKDGKEIFYHEDGYSDIDKKNKIERNSIFRLYSMTKPITATSVMILFERGEIDLFDPVSKYLPNFKKQFVFEENNLIPAKREITIKDLLSMTSGLVYPGLDQAGKETDRLFKKIDKKLFSDNAISTFDAMNALGKIPLAFQPGESWCYGTSADVLGAVVEVASGMTFGKFLKKEIFIPLEMNNTNFYVSDENMDKLATTYEATENGLKIYNGNNLCIGNKMNRPPAFESGGAGLFGTIDDYAKFATMLINNGTYKDKEILKKSTVKFMTTQKLTDKQSKVFSEWHTLSGHTYGNLMRIADDPKKTGFLAKFGEYGWDGWLGCYFSNFPNEKLTILVMMQKIDAGTTSLVRKLRNVILGDINNI